MAERERRGARGGPTTKGKRAGWGGRADGCAGDEGMEREGSGNY